MSADVLRPVATLLGHTDAVTAVRLSPDGQFVISGGADRSLRLWNVGSGALLKTCTGHTQGVSDVAWTHDERVVVSASDDGSLRLWNIERGEALGEPLEGHINHAYCVDASSRTDLIVSGSFDESMRLWDSRVRRCVRVTPCHSEPVTSVCFSGDGTYIVSTSYDGLVRFWDTASGQCLRTLHADGAPPVTHARLSPNGRFLLATTLDGCARLWDVAESTVAKTYRAGHRRHAVQAAFARVGDGRQAVVVGCEDGSGPALFDVQTRRICQRLATAAAASDEEEEDATAAAQGGQAGAEGEASHDGSPAAALDGQGAAAMAVDSEHVEAPARAARPGAMALAVASSLDLRTVAAGTAAGASSAVLVWKAVEAQ